MNEKWNEDLVSVIMPVYNADKDMLHKAIKSILGQDWRNLECIIVEDPSPRASRPVIDRFNDPRVIYRSNERRTSFAQQLNLGLEMSKGQYVARMDGDDIAEPCRLRLQYQFLKQHPEISVVGTNLKIMIESDIVVGLRRYPQTSEKIALQMRRQCAVAHPSVMFKKQDVSDCGGFHPEFGVVADYDLWCRMVLAGRKFYNLPLPLLRYRIHGNASKVTSLKTTLQTTLEIKRRHFMGKKTLWGPREILRYRMEEILLLLPPRLVLKLFMFSSMTRLPRNELGSEI
jgi:glycosyltransferase involved in cell wall biosynthesis